MAKRTAREVKTAKAKEYRFTDKSHYPSGKAQEVGEHLDNLAGKAKTLTPRQVLCDAQKRSSPLHDLFEWDNNVAAGEYRLVQARLLLRSVTVVFVNEDGDRTKAREVRSFIHFDGTTERSEGCYVGTERVLAEDDLRARMVSRALAEAQSWRTRYEHLNELATVFTAIERIGQRLDAKKGAA